MDWLGELWPGLLWFTLGLGAMWGFLRILPGRLYRGEYNDLSPVTFYSVPSTVDSPEALSGEGHVGEGDDGATENGATEPAHKPADEVHMGEVHIAPLDDERRAALIEAIRAREGEWR